MLTIMPSKAPTVLASERQLLSELGARLRLARLRRKLAALAVARQAGISRTTLHNAESGNAAVTLGTYLRVLASLGLEQDIAMLAADDKVGRRLQDMQLDRKGARVRAARRASTSAPTLAGRAAASGRPRSLKEVALFGREQGDTDAFLREFLDEFYVTRDKRDRTAMLSAEPPLAADDRTNAYLAAVAEHLALRNGLPVPEWAGKPSRFLRRPFFPAGLESLKATLLVESPTAFRRRMIFVGADPLYRPRKDTVGIG
jgi:transcriptional regulator with XRE-family HTH domain